MLEAWLYLHRFAERGFEMCSVPVQTYVGAVLRKVETFLNEYKHFKNGF